MVVDALARPARLILVLMPSLVPLCRRLIGVDMPEGTAAFEDEKEIARPSNPRCRYESESRPYGIDRRIPSKRLQS
jgi:hypothetical protein